MALIITFLLFFCAAGICLFSIYSFNQDYIPCSILDVIILHFYNTMFFAPLILQSLGAKHFTNINVVLMVIIVGGIFCIHNLKENGRYIQLLEAGAALCFDID